METHRVLVTAVGGNIGQGVIKALRAGKRTYRIVGIDLNPLAAGRFLVDQFYVVPRTGEAGFQDAFEKIAAKEKIEAVFVCSPSELDFFALNKESLETKLGLSMLVNPARVVQIGADKLKTADFLKQAGLAYLETASLADKEGVEALIQKRGFPLLVKPREGFSSRHVYIVHRRAEIEAAKNLTPDLILQRYIPNEKEEYTAATLSGTDGKVRSSIILRRELCQGTTYRTELIQDPHLTDQIETIAGKLGAVGVCNLQFRVLDGTVFIFEINPRFSGSGGIRHYYGYNEAEMAFELIRLGLESCRPVLRPGVVLRYWNEIFVPGATFSSVTEGKNHFGVQTVVEKPLPEKGTAAPVGGSELEQMDILDTMAEKYFTEKALGPDRKQMEFIMDAFLSHCTGPKILELGCGNGNWTRKLVGLGNEVTVVEGSSILAEELQREFGASIKVVHSLFENYRPAGKFDSVIASCVLEHVEDARSFLSLIKNWLKPGGHLHLVVPNALSLHRRVGLKMGLLSHALELSPQEIEVGHRRAYTYESFKEELEASRFKIDFIKGIFLKPLSSGQMLDWSERLLEGYNQLSDDLPEYTAFLYAKCALV